MSPAAQGVAAAARRRPRDRKEQIVRAAARAFSERGYRAVGVDDIAAEVGISGPALYRHYAGKYALLVAAAEYTVGALLAASRAADDRPDRPADERLCAVLDALIRVTIKMRPAGAFYRWEGRYLEAADRRRIRDEYDALNAAIAEPLRLLRPQLPAADVAMLAAAALSVIGSISAHRSVLAAQALRPLLLGLCTAVLSADLPPAPPGPAPDRSRGGLHSESKREQLLTEAIRVFARRGFVEASLDEIGRGVGLNASSVYRHYPSKAALLTAALQRAGDRVLLIITDALGACDDPRAAALDVARRYLALSFADPDLISIYFAEFANLPESDRVDLRRRQRQNIGEWAGLLRRSGVPPEQAVFRVHAALALVVDLGRLVGFDQRPEQRARVQTLMAAVLFAEDGASARVFGACGDRET